MKKTRMDRADKSPEQVNEDFSFKGELPWWIKNPELIPEQKLEFPTSFPARYREVLRQEAREAFIQANPWMTLKGE